MSQAVKLWKFHGGLHLDYHKSESTQEPVADLPLPASVTLPIQQHIGKPAEVLVSVGQSVRKGEVIANALEYVSAPVHASISGTVVAVELRPVPHPSGMSAICVVIESDGQDEWTNSLPEPMADWRDRPAVELRNRIRDSGIVGLGGAAFPTAVKLNSGSQTVQTLVVNGAECEPYITCDDMLMRLHANDIVNGIAIVQHMLNPGEILIGIEDNKPKAIAAMEQAVSDAGLANTHVVAVPTVYPTGGEKQLIRVLTGKEVPSMGLPLSVGVICQNVGTLLAIHNAVVLGLPLIDRLVTVSGDAVNSPRNLRVRNGTAISELVAAAKGYTPDAHRLIMGGPMMGFALPSDNLPVIKSTNCILVASQALAPTPDESSPCIRCGECMKVCPANLLPQQLYWYTHARDFDKVQDYKLFDCIECGCCAVVCPSKLPLVQFYRFAKAEIWTQEKRKAKSDQARERHEFRTERLDRAAREKAERLAKKKAALDTNSPGQADAADPKKAAIAAAMARVKAKKAETAATDADNTPSAGNDSEQ